MFFNSRSLLKAAVVSYFALEASAYVLKPIPSPQPLPPARRAVDFIPITSDDLGEVKGNHVRRDDPGHGVFDPCSSSQFFWGAYAGDNMYTANFTLQAPGDDELILPVEKFAKHLKSIDCGKPGEPMALTFADKDSFDYAQKQWKWVDDQDINHFILVTQANQCYQGDDRSPYLVNTIRFDEQNLCAHVTAQEKQWNEVAGNFHLHVGHEPKPNVTHHKLVRKDEKKMDLTMDYNQKIFDFAKDSSDTNGLALSANAHVSTGGFLLADFDMETKFFIPTDVNIKVHPQGAWGQILLDLNLDGTLGKPLDWTMKPEIEIPVEALNIKDILQIGPFVTMGVHFGSSSLTGTGTLSTGAKGTLKDSAEVDVKLRDPSKNSITDWDPQFEKVDPTFSAEIGGDFRVWGELGIELKVEALKKWGYQASVDAELPYFEATMAAKVDTEGVCGTQKTKGIDLGAAVGINVHLDAGPAEGNPDFQKQLYDTQWPLFSTCIGVGPDDVKTSTPEPTPTEEPTPTDQSSDVPASTDVGATTDLPSMPLTTAPPMVTSTGTASAGYPIAANTTFLKMHRRHVTQLY